ncbi:transposase [Bradyrhizobium barranii]
MPRSIIVRSKRDDTWRLVGLAPSPYNSGDTGRDRGIHKAGTKLARQTLVELAWFWLRYQPNSKLSLWWQERFGGMGVRGRKVGHRCSCTQIGHRLVALCRARGGTGGRYVEGLTRTMLFLSLPQLR